MCSCEKACFFCTGGGRVFDALCAGWVHMPSAILGFVRLKSETDGKRSKNVD